jgi:hypothetical protein
MNRIENRMAAGFLAAAVALAPMAFAVAADRGAKAAQPPAKPRAANAPPIARIVVTPSAEQMAKLRAEQRMVTRERDATVARQGAAGDIAATRAL